jgi:hypothetical protein
VDGFHLERSVADPRDGHVHCDDRAHAMRDNRAAALTGIANRADSGRGCGLRLLENDPETRNPPRKAGLVSRQVGEISRARTSVRTNYGYSLTICQTPPMPSPVLSPFFLSPE